MLFVICPKMPNWPTCDTLTFLEVRSAFVLVLLTIGFFKELDGCPPAPPTTLVPVSLTVLSVALVQGGGLDGLGPEENRHRKTGDNGSLLQLF